MENANITALENDVRKYRRTVFAVAIGYVKNTHDADDITQDVFLKLYQSCEQFDTEENKKAWLIRVTINAAKDYLRSSWRKNTCELDESLIAPQYINDDGLDLHDYLKRLAPKYRTVIFLHYYEGYSAKEVAQMLKLPQTTVRTQLRRAREQLKEMITTDEKEDYCYGTL